MTSPTHLQVTQTPKPDAWKQSNTRYSLQTSTSAPLFQHVAMQQGIQQHNLKSQACMVLKHLIPHLRSGAAEYSTVDYWCSIVVAKQEQSSDARAEQHELSG